MAQSNNKEKKQIHIYNSAQGFASSQLQIWIEKTIENLRKGAILW